MSKKPMQRNNYGHQHRKQRYSQGGGNRPRKNYSASREKYLSQARDAMASGDRVMAEYFYQHADHCYRMMMEEGFRPNRPQQNSPQAEESSSGNETSEADSADGRHASQLPAFITSNYEGQDNKAADVPVQNWEERDA